MARLPIPGSDDGNWGEILNEYLSQSLEADGSLKEVPVTNVTGLQQTLGQKVALPEVYIDPRLHVNGPVASTTQGTFIGSYGNSPASILNGSIVHTPSTGSNTACYIEARLSDTVTRIGALVEFPDTAVSESGAVALVIPSSSWMGAIGTAGVHVVIAPDGQITQARYQGGTVNQAYGKTPAALVAGRHTIEVLLDHRLSVIRVYIDGDLIVEKRDATAFGMISDRAIWELYEYTGTAMTPARLLATWADTEQRVPSALAISGPTAPRPALTAYYTNATYTAGTSSASTAISSALATTASVFPRSGRIAVTWSGWVDGTNTTGIILGSVNGSSAMKLAEANFKGRVTYMGVLTGIEGQNVTLSPNIWTTAGTVNVISGGSSGSFVVRADPL